MATAGGNALLELTVNHTDSDAYMRYKYTDTRTEAEGGDAANDIQWVHGFDGDDSDIFNFMYVGGDSATALTPSTTTVGSTEFSISTIGNIWSRGDLTVNGADITIGTDSDGTDRAITFGHSTLKTIMGIDDSADAFVINTDAAFDGTLANNSLSIDASHNVIIAGTATAGGFTTTGTWTMDTSAGGTTGITSINITNAFTDDDVTIMSAGAIKEKIESYGYSTTTGDITGVTLTGDSGGALADTAGSADFTIAGGTNCTSSGSGSTITLNVDDSFIKNDAADIMVVSDFGANAALKIDADQPATAGAEDSVGLWIDYDRIVAGSGTAAHNDIGIDLDVNAASLGTSSVTGMDIDVVGATSGTHTAIGIDLDVDSADTNIGMQINTAGTHMKLVANADADDYATITVADTGDLTIATVGDGTTDSDLTLDADGDIELNADGGDIRFKDGLASIAQITGGDARFYYNATNYLKIGISSAGVASLITVGGTAADADFAIDAGGDITLDSGTGIFIAKNAGTEFSIANSAYAGMIIGYTCVGNDAADDSYTLTTSFVCFQDSGGTAIKVSFITPPSDLVEIEVSLFFSAGSGAQDLELSLSDNATYASSSLFHEDNYQNIVCEPARGNGGTIVHKWLLKGAQLEAIGSNNDIFIAARCDATTGTPIIKWGGSATGEFTNLYLKATALPATIVEGS